MRWLGSCPCGCNLVNSPHMNYMDVIWWTHEFSFQSTCDKLYESHKVNNWGLMCLRLWINARGLRRMIFLFFLDKFVRTGFHGKV